MLVLIPTSARADIGVNDRLSTAFVYRDMKFKTKPAFQLDNQLIVGAREVGKLGVNFQLVATPYDFQAKQSPDHPINLVGVMLYYRFSLDSDGSELGLSAGATLSGDRKDRFSLLSGRVIMNVSWPRFELQFTADAIDTRANLIPFFGAQTTWKMIKWQEDGYGFVGPSAIWSTTKPDGMDRLITPGFGLVARGNL